jgi:hypothetical protein
LSFEKRKGTHKLIYAVFIAPIIEVMEGREWEKDIPMELFLKIFSYLSLRDCNSIAVVCRTFKQIVDINELNKPISMKSHAEKILSRTSEYHKSNSPHKHSSNCVYI